MPATKRAGQSDTDMSGPAVTIYHNPACGTSRNVLALIRNAGVEPTVRKLKLPGFWAGRVS